MNINCDFIGDYKVGKTCLAYSYIKNYFPFECFPSNQDFYNFTVKYRGTTVNFKIYDHPSSQDYRNIRSNIYPQIDVMIICFSLIDENSYKNVEKNWIPILKQYCPNKPYILVGTKCDLRLSPQIPSEIKRITKSQGKELKDKIGAFSYIECSALQKYNIKEVFGSAIQAVLNQNKSQNKLKNTINCNIT